MVEHCPYLAEVEGSIPLRAYQLLRRQRPGRTVSSEQKTQPRRLRSRIAALVLLTSALLPVWQKASIAQSVRLPERTGELKGSLKRGPDGRLQLVPDSIPAEARPDDGPLPPPGSRQTIRQSVDWAHQRLQVVGGYDHDRHVRALQQQIDDMIARERRAKGTGAGVRVSELTQGEKQIVAQLKSRDREVRQHEARHYNMGRPFTQPPRYWYVTGPDGRRYAVSGAVSFAFQQFSGDAVELLHQLSVLQRAALAPREPSSTDLAVARALGEIIQGLRTRMAASR